MTPWIFMTNSGSRLTTFNKIAYLIFGALFIVFAFPPFQTGFLAWFALIPLLIVIEDSPLSKSLFYGYVFGMLVSLFGLWWLVFPSPPGMIMAVVYLSIFWAFFAYIYKLLLLKNKTLALISMPFLLVFIEYIRGVGRLGFPWQDFAYTQTYYTKFIQFADITGSSGITFFVACINVLFFLIIKNITTIRIKKVFIWLGVLIGALSAVYLYGNYKINQYIEYNDYINIALLQGNVDPYVKWDRDFRKKNMEIYIGLIDSTHREQIDLYALPETATAGYWQRSRTRFYLLEEKSDLYRLPIIAGTLDYNIEEPTEYYNAAYLINPDGDDKIYRKIQLVPFAEQIPFQEDVDFLRKLDFGGSHFTRGEEYTVFNIKNAKIAVPICIESLFPDHIREFCLRGANLILNITNDGWFKKTQGPYQHFRFNVIRAIENRVSVARAANTGFSALIDPAGRVISSTDLFKKEVLIVRAPLNNQKTFYTRYGNIPQIISVIYISTIFIYSIIRGAR